MSDFDLRRSEPPGISTSISASVSERPETTTVLGFLVSATLHAGILFLLAGFSARPVLHAPASPIDVTFVEAENHSDRPQPQAATLQADAATATAIPASASGPVTLASPTQAIPDAAALPEPQPAVATQPAAATHRLSPKSIQSKPAEEKPAETRPTESKPAQAKPQRVAKSSPSPSEAAVKTPPEQVKSEYAGLIQTIIARNRIYPQEAQAARLEGSVVVHFLLTPKGKIKNLSIVQSSGHDILDLAAKETIRRSSPFPPVPAAFGTGGIDMRLNMNYKLN